MMPELSMHLLDIAENAVSAGASRVEILVEEQPERDLLTLTVADNGSGMTEDELAQVTDPFFTSRTTRRVGLGVPFFQMAARMAGGDLSIESAPGQGTRICATFCLGHIDRMPLGNINETVSVLIQGNPRLDVLFVRRLGEREMTLDTRQFREVLGDIPLDAPEVSLFIREFLEEHTSALLENTKEDCI